MYNEIVNNLKEAEDFAKWTVEDFIADGRYTYTEKIKYIASILEESGNVDVYPDERWNEVLKEIARELNTTANNIDRIERRYKGGE